MHDPMTVAFDVPSYKARQRWPWLPHLVTVWHVDPERDGSDDSCDWFGGRSLTPAQKATLGKIAADFAFEWHRDAPYERFGWFMPEGEAVGPDGQQKWWDGEPNYSSHAITLAMFRIAANHHFGHWSGRAAWFLRRHAFDILLFAENSCDSLCDDIEQKHGARDGSRERQAEQFAAVVYGWILRAERPWWRHPRWHLHHWRLQIHPLQSLRRLLFTRCVHCGGRFKRADSAVGYHWDAPPRRWFEWFRSERGLAHSDCSHKASAACAFPKEG